MLFQCLCGLEPVCHFTQADDEPYKFSRLVKGGWKILRLLYGCDIPYDAKIHESVVFAHSALGCVVHPETIIEENVVIQHHVTPGTNKDPHGAPIIHKNVFIGAYAMILGKVEIGENAVIGAGSLVMHDVDANSTYFEKRCH